MSKRFRYWSSPIGSLLLAGEERLQIVGFATGSKARRADADWVEDRRAFADVAEQLGEYFAGERQGFDLDLDLRGTPFQLDVWRALREIPYGDTVSYGDIARQIDRSKAVRAVGTANGSNPIPVIVPCHRVIGASGKLTGFGGGLEAKSYLLNLESPALQLMG